IPRRSPPGTPCDSPLTSSWQHVQAALRLAAQRGGGLPLRPGVAAITAWPRPGQRPKRAFISPIRASPPLTEICAPVILCVGVLTFLIVGFEQLTIFLTALGKTF